MRRTALLASVVMAMLLPMSAAMAQTVLGDSRANTLRGTDKMDLIKGRGGETTSAGAITATRSRAAPAGTTSTA